MIAPPPPWGIRVYGYTCLCHPIPRFLTKMKGITGGCRGTAGDRQIAACPQGNPPSTSRIICIASFRSLTAFPKSCTVIVCWVGGWWVEVVVVVMVVVVVGVGVVVRLSGAAVRPGVSPGGRG